MSFLVREYGDAAIELILEDLRARDGRQPNGSQISSRTILRILKQWFGQAASYVLCPHVEEILLARRTLILFVRSQNRKVFWVNINTFNIPVEETA